MPIEDMNCPNCGAPIDFAGGSTTRCSFCNSNLTLTHDGVEAASALNDLLANSTPAGVDVERVRLLVQAGKKIEAIKLVREETDLGLKEAKDIVEAIERGETPTLPPRAAPRAATHGISGVDVAAITALLAQNKKIEAIKLYREQTGLGLKEAKDAVEALEASGEPLPATGTPTMAYRPPHPQKSTVGCAAGCLPMLFFMVLCAGFVMLTSQIAFRVWGPLDQSLSLVNSDPAIVSAFGQPLKLGPFITGSINSSGASSRARFEVPIYGPKRSGTLSVSGSWRSGVWDLTVWVTFEVSGEEQTLRISQKVK